MVYELTMLEFDEETQTARLAGDHGERHLRADSGRRYRRVRSAAGAYAASLRRTRIGAFSVDEALSPEELSPERYAAGGRGVLSLDEALDFLPRHDLSEARGPLAANGNELRGAPVGRFRVYGAEGLLGIYEGRGEVARPLVMFPRSA